MNLPDEIARREDRIKAITEAKTKIEGRAKERFDQEQAEYDVNQRAVFASDQHELLPVVLMLGLIVCGSLTISKC